MLPTPKRSVTAPLVSMVPKVEKPMGTYGMSRIFCSVSVWCVTAIGLARTTLVIVAASGESISKLCPRWIDEGAEEMTGRAPGTGRAG